LQNEAASRIAGQPSWTHANVQTEPPVDESALSALESRLGRLYARQRLGIERAHESRVFGYGLNFFHPENWYATHSLIAAVLKLSGLYWHGQKNARAVRLKRNTIASPRLPSAFDGFTILHLSDLHVDTNSAAMDRVAALISQLRYDLCVLTGDYRGRTAGPYEATLKGLERVRAAIKGEAIFGVLGNHDTIAMVPGMEAMGIKMLLNESFTFAREEARVHLVGVDDAHYFRVDNIEKAAAHIAEGEFSILLSHTPEIYRQAAHAGFAVMLCGHTHGGQICLPGSIPITLDSALPRRMASGAWLYHGMIGYTSVGAGTSIVPVRLNCPPEITLHRLERAEPSFAASDA
jgi:predicted MPP superfamily phosphohydrolase